MLETKVGTPLGVADVEARLACTDLINSFGRLVDSGQAGKAVELFTEAGVLVSPGQVIRGREELAKAFAAREADADRRTVHQVTNVVFEAVGPETARAQSIVCLYVLGRPGELTPRALSRFDDEFERGEDGRWRFSRRTAAPLAGGR
ncbi:hypothetical protein GCM10022222_07760 [Amycolatopsis ultiminotia]|uniref:SnoaL-like domain-containing protein n=1 Tax=Amycolatopsis ultiminotia TaxID=543629 RepID=A0ABP6V1X1_9PSEU